MYTSFFRKAMLGDTATLSLDFSAGSLPTAVTFTRADSTARATYIDANGYVKTVASAGAPRFDYVGGVAKGLLIEAQAVNVAIQSEAFTASGFWGYNATAQTIESSDINPRGTTGSISVAPASNGASRYLGAFATGLTAGSVYTYSIWLKAKGTAAAEFILFNSAGTISSGITILSQPSGGSATVSNSPGIVPRISGLSSSGWTRIAVTTTAALGGTGTGNFFLYPSNISASTTADSIYIWGAQIEVGSITTSYIPTTTAALTRLADDAVIRSTAWTGLYSKPGTIVVEYYRGEYGAGDRSVLAIDTAATKHIHLKHANASAASGIYNSAGLGVANKLAGNAAGLNKAAFNWSSANPSIIKYALNGNAVVASGTSDIGATLGTWMTIGSASTTGVSGSGTWEGYLNNSIKSVKYYSELLSDAEMIAKTT